MSDSQRPSNKVTAKQEGLKVRARPDITWRGRKLIIRQARFRVRRQLVKI
jgi:hypothetical protein